MPVPQVQRVAAYVVCVRDGQVLLSRLTPRLGSRWTLPGGGIDHGEHPVDAAVREVAEETGLDVTIDRLLTVDSVHVTVDLTGAPSDHHAVRILYAGTVVGGTLRNEVGGSSDTAAWIPLDAVDALDQVGLVGVGLGAWAGRAGAVG